MTAARFQSAGFSHQGFVRGNNEDRIHADDERGIFLVVDGMGGHAAGEKAAEIAVEHLRARLERRTDSVERRVREAIALANNAIFSSAQNNDEWKGMACVVTLAVIDNGDAVIGHVGDSRLYRIRNGGIEKITHDHSPVGEREDSGQLTEREAMAHPRRNEVYRDVGSREHTPDDDDFIEVARIPFKSDTALLLCSDGLSDAIPSARILEIVSGNAGQPQAAVEKLVEAAIEQGKDNVSAVLVEGERFAQVSPRPPVPSHSAPWLYLIGGLLAGALAALIAQYFLFPVPVRTAPSPITVGPQGARFQTITAAVDFARAGDAIEVAPGDYPEPIHLKSGVVLTAREAHRAVIRCPEGAACVAVTAEGVQRARLSGFRIEGDVRHPLDTGILVAGSDVDIARAEITGARHTGVTYSGASTGILQSSLIHDNPGTGILVNHPAAPAIENNIIRGNGSETRKPGLEIRSLAGPVVAGNTFAGNGADAVWLTAADPLLVPRNFFLPEGKPGAKSPVRVLLQGAPGR